MNKPVSELIALAANCPELNMSNYTESDVEELNNWAIEVATTIDRTAANQSGSERAGVDALREALRYADASDWDYIENLLVRSTRHSQDAQTMFWRAAMSGLRKALVTPPAQPAPARQLRRAPARKHLGSNSEF